MATSSLAYILDSSDAAKTALQDMLHTGGADVGTIARVADEVVGEDQERVDLVAYNEASDERVLIEAKFWAHLTENQPGTYLKRLPADDKPAVLLFLAPEKRLHTLWPELQRRAREGGLELDVADEAGDLRTATIAGSNRHLMLTSWRALLGAMECRARLADDKPTCEDIRQLNGLCEMEDVDAFLPLREDELSSNMARRLLDLKRLVDDATTIACEERFAKDLQETGAHSHFGKNLRLGSEAKGVWARAWFGVYYKRWRDEDCPLSIEMEKPRDPSDMSQREATTKLGYQYGWIDIPTGKEYHDVLKSVVVDLHKHAQRLADEIGPDEWDEYIRQETG